MHPLSPEFYNRSALQVAPDLLGCLLIRTFRGKTVTGRIVEVEAYRENDPASHSFAGLTARNKSMFGPPGHLYVYFTYGMHFCANVVTREEGVGEAVLLRAVEPLTGIETMTRRRFGRPVLRSKADLLHLARGPGRLCEAFHISRSDDGCPLDRDPLFIASSGHRLTSRVIRTERIGIRRGTEKRWRFLLGGEPWVSGRRAP